MLRLTPVLTGPIALPRCTVAYLSRSGRSWQTARVDTRVRTMRHLVRNQAALVGCSAGATWLSANVLRGHRITVATSFTGGPVQSLISGGRVLIRDGKRYADPSAHGVSGHNAETFACVGGNGTKLLLGVIDKGWHSAGVTNREL